MGAVIVSIPSMMTPRFWNSDDSAHMIHMVMEFSLRTSAVAAATAPTEPTPMDHSQIE